MKESKIIPVSLLCIPLVIAGIAGVFIGKHELLVGLLLNAVAFIFQIWVNDDQ